MGWNWMKVSQCKTNVSFRFFSVHVKVSHPVDKCFVPFPLFIFILFPYHSPRLTKLRTVKSKTSSSQNYPGLLRISGLLQSRFCFLPVTFSKVFMAWHRYELPWKIVDHQWKGSLPMAVTTILQVMNPNCDGWRHSGRLFRRSKWILFLLRLASCHIRRCNKKVWSAELYS